MKKMLEDATTESREELFALVWEKSTSEIARELGLSDVAIGKLCTKLMEADLEFKESRCVSLRRVGAGR